MVRKDGGPLKRGKGQLKTSGQAQLSAAKEIDRYLASLTRDQLELCAEKVKKLLARPVGRPKGWSKDPFQVACRKLAAGALRQRQLWLDAPANRRRRQVPRGFYDKIIANKLPQYEILLNQPDRAKRSILGWINKRVREVLLEREIIALRKDKHNGLRSAKV
ncbi:hypothetical protein WHZ78_01750 [Bradyrhizobium symbiodeficiens]|uniref:hypothetical protein n=1 Tax=Bradyrhizobium symbiodeficiens TaxID=1404367 RepID=UPI0030D4682F